MRRLLLLIAAIIMSVNGNIQAQGLKETINSFIQAMENTEATQQDFIERLKPLIDPASNVDSLCLDYYKHWKYNTSNKSFPLNSKVEKIQKESVGKAVVLISNIWQIPDDGKYYFMSETTWLLKNGKWYRSGEPAKIIERKKIQ